ncbi:OmpA family protein [Marinilabilia salmonicolor]|jgi:outer membrane protein OmpA-like peptidoglycan-associated protein|uniref:Outer membrane protein OmpA-like peptidoglycan-associated protein n=1 Tax=Marinilabilia salmonicolor TaxID=989 RepID=A0A2T0XH37_9BACT|nr:OmpA family protein [Marinilabilia salmonicolor]PRY98269.1 outer membrane protein OmpA-like peptidoglycan-associated protein [Marinilabilia salmonicolor]RCW33843.1 outer membrane protein OmpA-like peptidoglycan-associated protein [Marinilabilia salmonicolor]
MNKLKMSFLTILCSAFFISGCASWNKTQKGAAVGTVAGGAAGAVIGRASDNTALGAIIGAAAGGAAGAVIGRQMDKQAEEIEKSVPDAKVERVGEGIVVEFSSNILFGFDESNLSQDAKKNLDKLVVVLESYADTNIEIQGHTDSKGSEAYNQNLSEQRARMVSRYLSANGVAYSRLNVKGFGETAPRYENDTANGRAQNRRVEFLITANEKMKAEAEKEASN